MKVRQHTVDNGSFLAQRRYVGRKYLVVREGWKGTDRRKKEAGGRLKCVDQRAADWSSRRYFGKLSWAAQKSCGCVKGEVVVFIVDFQLMLRWNIRCVGERMQWNKLRSGHGESCSFKVGN